MTQRLLESLEREAAQKLTDERAPPGLRAWLREHLVEVYVEAGLCRHAATAAVERVAQGGAQ